MTRARAPESALEISALVKDYHGLRPLRISSLAVAAGERVSLLGLDAHAAEVFVNLVTGAALPDQGEVRVFGRATADIADSGDWLSLVDRFGIVSARAVLLDALTVVQNLAMPFTLEVEPPPAGVRERATLLAREVGLGEDLLDRQVGELAGADRMRVRLGRALALDPAIVLFEHPTAEVVTGDVRPLASHCRDVAVTRHIAAITLTADRKFAEIVGTRVLTLRHATGQLAGSGWFSSLRRD